MTVMTKCAILAAGTSLLAFAPAMAQSEPAATAAVSDADDGNSIVVTARRREERLTDVPAAISVVTAETLAAKGITTPSQLTQAVPSLQQSSSGYGNATPHFLIRGQRQQLEFIQSDQSVGIYVDEIVVPRQQGLNAGLFDIANIQVLKGPQGTLFGKNQTGGAILFTSETPKSEFGGNLTAAVGNYDARRLEGALNIPITDSLQIRLAGQINRRDGYMHNVSDGRYYNDTHTDGWRVSVHYAPGQGVLENWLIVSGSKEKEIGALPKQLPQYLGLPGVGTSGLFTLFGNPQGDALYSGLIQKQARTFGRFETAGVSPYQLANGKNIDIDNFAITNKTEWHINDNVTLRNIFGYRYLNSYQSANIAGVAGFNLIPGTTATTATAARLVSPLGPDGLPQLSGNIVCGPQSGYNCLTVGFYSMNYTKQRQVSEEVNLLGKLFDSKLDYIVGGYYFREHGVGITSNFVPISQAPRIGIAQNEPANESKAVFGQVTWHVLDAVSLTGGLRQTWDRRETNARNAISLKDYFPWSGDGIVNADGVNATCGLQNSPTTFLPNNTPTNPDNCLLSASAKFSKLTYSASVDWHLDKDALLYFVTRRGYRSGGFNQSATLQSATNPTVLTPFRPETVTDYEVGLKGSWRLGGMRAELNVAAYRNNYNDIQRALTTLVGSRTVTANAATATIQGIEVEAKLEPTNWLELSGYYSYINAKFKKFIVPNNGLFRDVGDFTRSKFSGVPTDSGGATVRLHGDLPNDNGTLSASADYYGQTGYYLQDNNFDAITQTFIAAEYVPGYGLLGANLSWQGVMGKSIDANFNIRNITNKRYITGGVDGSTSRIGTLAHFLGEPRMYTFTVSYRF